MKSLMGITPSSVRALVSALYAGSTTDKEMMGGFLGTLSPGDEVMADKGFNIQDELAAVGATLVIQHF